MTSHRHLGLISLEVNTGQIDLTHDRHDLTRATLTTPPVQTLDGRHAAVGLPTIGHPALRSRLHDKDHARSTGRRTTDGAATRPTTTSDPCDTGLTNLTTRSVTCRS